MKTISTITFILLLTFCVFSCKKEPISDPTPETGTVTDFDGNVYRTIKIGTQWWMTENLKTTKYRDGSPIPNVTNNAAWITLSTPAYCSYNNDYNTYGRVYGLLYNWFVVDPSSNGNKTIAPQGWHVPTNAEFLILVNYLGGVNVAGGKLKETGTTHWTAPNNSANNSTGFTAIPPGYRGWADGVYGGLGVFVHWWSVTQNSTTEAWNLSMINEDAIAHNSSSVKKLGFSVICVKD